MQKHFFIILYKPGNTVSKIIHVAGGVAYSVNCILERGNIRRIRFYTAVCKICKFIQRIRLFAGFNFQHAQHLQYIPSQHKTSSSF